MARIDPWIRIPLKDLSNPEKPGPIMVYKDRYWLVDANKNALFYENTSHPQCHQHQQALRNTPADLHIDSEIIFVSWAYVPIDDFI